MSTLIMKFGGTSTGSEYALNRATELVFAQTGQWDHVIVVVSAMDGVTNLLLDCAELSLSSDFSAWEEKISLLRERLEGMIRSIFDGDRSRQPLLDLIYRRMVDLTNICQQIRIKGSIDPQDLDEIAALGERINAHVFSALLCKRGILSQAVEAINLIVTDTCHQSASPIQPETDACIKTLLSPLLAADTIPVVTGFIGATPEGKTTTLGRGGSDYTAAIIGKSLGADEIWIWTDVDGIMSTDPKLTSRARLIPEISYQEVYKLSYYGAKVLHPKTIRPACEDNIPIWVKNTFNTGSEGTRISKSQKPAMDTITAITGYINVILFTVQVEPGRELLMIKDQIHKHLVNRGIHILLSSLQEDEDTVSFAFDRKFLRRAIQVLIEAPILGSFDVPISQVQSTDNMAIIAIIGSEIHTSNIIQLKISTLLEKTGVHTHLMDRDTTPDCLVYLVNKNDVMTAIKNIHDEVIIHEQMIPFKAPSPIHHSELTLT